MVSSTRASFGRRALWSGYWRLVVWMYPWGIILQKAFVPGILFYMIYFSIPVADKLLFIKNPGSSDLKDFFHLKWIVLTHYNWKKYHGSVFIYQPIQPSEWNWAEQNFKKGKTFHCHFYVKTMSARIFLAC